MPRKVIDAMTNIIELSGGNLDKAVRLFKRTHGDLTGDDADFAAAQFNTAWQKLVPERPLKIAKGSLKRLIRGGRIKPPAGYAPREALF